VYRGLVPVYWRKTGIGILERNWYRYTGAEMVSVFWSKIGNVKREQN